jgi:hypothetical protein
MKIHWTAGSSQVLAQYDPGLFQVEVDRYSIQLEVQEEAAMAMVCSQTANC